MEKLTQIEAGRELDALVAMEVMGWTQVNPRWWVRLDGASVPHPPTYSTTGDGMLAVLERMRELGWRSLVTTYGERIEAMFYPGEGWPIYAASADTLPHAVCLAALEAVRA